MRRFISIFAIPETASGEREISLAGRMVGRSPSHVGIYSGKGNLILKGYVGGKRLKL